MPADPDLATLRLAVLWGGFALAFVFGFVAHRTHFCAMGAVADVVGMGHWDRMRMWVLAMATAMLGTSALVGLGLIDTAKTIYTAPRLPWLSALVGGAAFGFGMVLASGCGSKTLIRIGTGNLKSLVVFVVMGISAYMTMRGLFAVWRTATVDTVATALPAPQDLGALIAAAGGFERRTAQACTGVVVGALMLAWVLLPRGFRASPGKTDVLLGGLTVGALAVAAWILTGHLGHVAEDPNTLEERFIATNSGRMEGLSFVAPFAYLLELLMLWSDKSLQPSFGVACVAGVIAGSFVHALLTHGLRWEGFAGLEDTAHHLAGATLMGAGGVTALGCTIGQGITGLSTLALGSVLATIAIVGGAAAAVRYQVWRIERAATATL